MWYLVIVVEINLLLMSGHPNCLVFKRAIAIELISGFFPELRFVWGYDRNCLFFLCRGYYHRCLLLLVCGLKTNIFGFGVQSWKAHRAPPTSKSVFEGRFDEFDK